MIPYPELERALQRWKARQAGGVDEAATETPSDGSVTVESAYMEAEAEAAFPSQNAGTNEIVLESELEEH